MLTLADITKGTGGWIAYKAEDFPEDSAEVGSVSIDSRSCEAGSLFVAIAGERYDGHDFITSAVRQGAVAVLVDAGKAQKALEANPAVVVAVADTLTALQNLAHFWRRSRSVDVIGITGSLGKTTTKELVAAVLGQRFKVLKSEGNLNTEYGLPLTLLKLEPEHQIAVMEMGGGYRMGEIAELSAIAEPRIGIVTNVAPVHLERMGTIEAIAETKSELVASLPDDGIAVLNHDNEYVRSMRLKARCPVLMYGTGPDCDVFADEVQSFGLEGIGFRLNWEGRRYPFRVSLRGRHSVYTALAAAAAGLLKGLGIQEIREGMASFEVKGRLAIKRGVLGTTLIDDTYNASPDAMVAALDLLAEAPGRHIAVLADMLELGSYEVEGHECVGRRASRDVDHLILFGPLSRTVGEAAIASGMPRDRVKHFEDKTEVIAYLKSIMRTGDTILFKGSRGMAVEEVVKEVRDSN